MTRIIATLVLAGGIVFANGCGQPEKRDQDWYTSGSAEADQRAEQRIIKDKQIQGDDAEKPKPSLYERLGGEKGLTLIVDDFVARVLADPRVNWQRKGVKSGGVLGIGDTNEEWQASAENVDKLKKHLREFLAVATGGPTQYGGGEMKSVHAGMGITNVQFNAAVGDFKQSMDNLKVPVDEQRELLKIIETTREQIVEER